MVTPRAETSRDRYDFAELGETIAASLVVPAAQEQTKQFADDIRSQVAERSRGLSRIAQLDQRTALPDQCLPSAEADVRPPRRKSGF